MLNLHCNRLLLQQLGINQTILYGEKKKVKKPKLKPKKKATLWSDKDVEFKVTIPKAAALLLKQRGILNCFAKSRACETISQQH
jgi:ribosomal protein L11